MDPVTADKPQDSGKEKRKKKQEEKKPQGVKKVSPVARFFSSMKVKFTSIIIFYTLLSVVIGCVYALYACLDVYERTDVLNMQEMVQSVVGGIQITSNGFIQRGGLGIKQIGSAFNKDFSVLSNVTKTEVVIARYIHEKMTATMDGPGLTAFNFMPMQLFMLWDENWTQRLVYYRPCLDNNNRTVCDMDKVHIFNGKEGDEPGEFVYFKDERGEFIMNETTKDKVPDFFKRIKDEPPTKCQAYGDCVGIANIPNDQGGPMMYFLTRVPFHVEQIAVPLRGWNMLWAANMLFFNQIAANRTGLCYSGYSSNETGLPSEVKKEYEKKKEQKIYGFINPHDSYYDNTLFTATFHQDTDNVTLAQEFTSTTRYITPERQYCDINYDYGKANPRSKSTVFLAYNFLAYKSAELLNDTYMLRIDYHNPISERSFTPFATAIICTSAAWFLTVCILVLYFNFSFLVPLEKMRKMRSDFIKTSLSGLDDDGTLAKEIFGSMVDDNALIDANGDEIRVMLTLQDRLNGFYTGLISSRSDELAHIKAHYQRRFNALKVMNYFMRRDEDDLQKCLPGLLDKKEVNRRFHRNAIASNLGSDAFVRDLGSARHTFRQFKAILGNELAIEFFKSFCVQRGRSTINSLFFVMDVSWLNQVEEGSKKGANDFLSSLFSDAISPSSNTPSGVATPVRSSFLAGSRNSFDSTIDSELISPRGEANRPHRSHFGKAKESSDVKKASDTESTIDTDKKDGEKKEEDKKDAGKKKLPFSKASSSRKQGSSALSLSSAADIPAGEEKAEKAAQAGPAFASPNGESIARFIHERYFGRKSLAQRDLKHAALLGCSQIPDYLTLRDGGVDVAFSPVMFNNLLAAVIKKVVNDVIPEFLDSIAFQVLVYCLILSNFFAKGKHVRADDDEVIDKKSNAFVKGIWEACRVSKQQKDDDDDGSSSDESDDEAKEKPSKTKKDKEEKEEKNDEGEGDKQ